MNFTQLLPCLFAVMSLTSCNSTNSINLKGSSESKEGSLASSFGISQKIEEVSIVHIDKNQRIVTIRSDSPMEKGYYLTISRHNETENSVLKLYDTSYQSIFIADILKGVPRINDFILPASSERSLELEQNYIDATID